MTKKLYIFMTALLLSIAVYGQGFQLVDSTFTQTKLDQDSLYYDEMAYLDDYHFHDNIFVLRTPVLVISLTMRN